MEIVRTFEVDKHDFKEVTLSTGYSDLNDCQLLLGALNYVTLKIRQQAHDQRPRYNEDSGSYVDTVLYNPREYAGNFAIFYFQDIMKKHFTLDVEEEQQWGVVANAWDKQRIKTGYPTMNIIRWFSLLELSILTQILVDYSMNVETFLIQQRETNAQEIPDKAIGIRKAANFLMRSKLNF